MPHNSSFVSFIAMSSSRPSRRCKRPRLCTSSSPSTPTSSSHSSHSDFIPSSSPSPVPSPLPSPIPSPPSSPLPHKPPQSTSLPSYHPPTSTDLSTFSTLLLDWYKQNARSLPWRVPPLSSSCNASKSDLPPAGSPYAIWVSEIMSQQTRISVVIPYYQRWMKRFPTVEHLANSDLEDVNGLWAGLGYYRRASNLHKGAKQVVEQMNGCIPESSHQLKKIQGIGRYTAGAISSIAFGERIAAVDGNVQRVLGRIWGVENENVWILAQQLINQVDKKDIGNWTQALMEFGALICTPKNVKCDICKVKESCGLWNHGKLNDIEDISGWIGNIKMNKKKKVKVRDEKVVVRVRWRNEKWWLRKRENDGLLHGFWEAPNMVVGNDNEDELINELKMNEYGNGEEIFVGVVKHVFSHIKQSLHVTLVIEGGDGDNDDDVKGDEKGNGRWVSMKEMKDMAVATQMRKVFRMADQKRPKRSKVRK